MSDILAMAVVVGVVIAGVLGQHTMQARRCARLARLEAKVDALLAAAGIAFDPMRDVPPAVREALERGETIVAIKRYRETTGVGLKEAKEFVEEVRRRRVAS